MVQRRKQKKSTIELMIDLAPVFANKSGFLNAQDYIHGFIGTAEGKNGWQLSE